MMALEENYVEINDATIKRYASLDAVVPGMKDVVDFELFNSTNTPSTAAGTG